jgi:hypothetical protein
LGIDKFRLILNDDGHLFLEYGKVYAYNVHLDVYLVIIVGGSLKTSAYMNDFFDVRVNLGGW